MPIPIYIICAQSGSEDRETGLISYFNVIEKIQVIRNQPQGADSGRPPVQLLTVKMMAVWMRSDDDSAERVFEFQIISIQQGANEQVHAQGEFCFLQPLHRITVNAQFGDCGPPGLFRIGCRIRPRGKDVWEQVQIYPIIVEEIAPQPLQQPQL